MTSPDPPDPEQLLDDGLEKLGLTGVQALRTNLLAYLDLLVRWNRRFNLVSRRTEAQMLSRHVFDCLVALPHIAGSRLLDVGSGAGLPGLLLGLANPRLDCVLLDSSAKKTRFCLQAVAILGATNIRVEHSRIEDYRSPQAFSTIIARAFGSTRALIDRAGHLCEPAGRIVAMKGAKAHAELDGLGAMRDNAEVVGVDVPGLASTRHLLIVEMRGS